MADYRELQFFDQDRKFAMTVKAVPSRFGPQQSASHPAKVLASTLPALDVAADSLHRGEGGFDEIGTAERAAELLSKARSYRSLRALPIQPRFPPLDQRERMRISVPMAYPTEGYLVIPSRNAHLAAFSGPKKRQLREIGVRINY